MFVTLRGFFVMRFSQKSFSWSCGPLESSSLELELILFYSVLQLMCIEVYLKSTFNYMQASLAVVAPRVEATERTKKQLAHGDTLFNGKRS